MQESLKRNFIANMLKLYIKQNILYGINKCIKSGGEIMLRRKARKGKNKKGFTLIPIIALESELIQLGLVMSLQDLLA